MKAPLTKVGELADQVRGVTYAKGDAELVPTPGYLPVIRAGNITDQGLTFDDLVYVPANRISASQLIRKHDVVVAASSGSLDVVGKAAPSPIDFDGGFGAFCKVLRPGKRVHPHYFAHYFKTSDYRRLISSLAAGANINNLRNEHLDNLLIPLPSLPEQRRIAAILDQAEVLRAKRRAALTKLDTLAQSIFVEMFGDYESVLHKWPTKRLGSILEFMTSGSRGWAGHYAESGDLFIRVQNVRRDELSLDDTAFVNAPDTAEAKRTKVEPGDVLLSITADLGRTAVIPPTIGRAFINQHLSILRTNQLVPRFLSAYLASPAGQQQILGRNKQGVKAGLNFDDIRSFVVPIPPESMQHRFRNLVEASEKLKATYLESLSRLDALFASVQHRAFREEL